MTTPVRGIVRNGLWNPIMNRILDLRGKKRIMDVSKVLAELRQEREQIDEAILSLERLVAGRGRRRGRPPAWMANMPAKRRGRPPGSKNKIPAVSD